MSTYLQLVNQTRDECAASGADLAALGGTLSKQNVLFKKWVADAWTSIQRRHQRWGFMERDFSFQTTAGVYTYAPTDAAVNLTSFREWKDETLRAYLTATGVSDEQLLAGPVHVQAFRDLYQFGTMSTTQQRPITFAIDPRKRLLLGPTPDAVYTIRGQYYKAPQVLSADADVPELDSYYHDLIVFTAMEKYALYQAAPEVLARSQVEGGRLMRELETEYLPKIEAPDPLA